MNVKILLNTYRNWIADLIFLLENSSDKELIIKDLKQYQIQYNDNSYDTDKSAISVLNYILACDLAYRSVFEYRIRNKIAKALFKLFWRPLNTIEIACHGPGKSIAGGLWISHNYCVLHVWSAGENLRVGPGVTVGMKNKGERIINPVIGDNVYIATNSTVIGGITIGDGAIIGAGSVVTKDVKSNTVVCGNPAKALKQNIKRRQ